MQSKALRSVARVVALLVASAAALAGSLPAASAAPGFTGAIPDLEVITGATQPTTFDFGPLFSSGSGGALSFSLYQVLPGHPFGGSPPPLLPARPPDEWNMSLSISGTTLSAASSNASAWGHAIHLLIRASDGSGSVQSNVFTIWLTAPPVTERTWITRDSDNGAFTTSSRRACGGVFHTIIGILVPQDAVVVEYSFVLSREPPPPPEGPNSTNGSEPPPVPYATSGVLIGMIEGDEVLNVSIEEQPTRVYVSTAAINARLASSDAGHGFGNFTIMFAACMEGGEAWVRAVDPIYRLLRFPAGDDLSDLNPHAPTARTLGAVSVEPGTTETDAVNLTAAFEDLDGEALFYEVSGADKVALEQAGLHVSRHGNTLDVEADQSAAPGNYTLRLTATDPLGAQATNDGLVIRVLGETGGGPSSPGPGPAPSGAVTPVQAAAVLGLVAAAVAVSTLEFLRYGLLASLFGAAAARTRKPSPLDHFVRGQLFQMISDNPGIHFMELVRRAQIGNGAATHHLRVLQKGGFIRVARDGTKSRFTATGHKPQAADYGLSVRDRLVLDAVASRPGIPQEDLAGTVGLSRSRVSRAVRRLTVLGLLKADKRGRSAQLYLRGEADLSQATHFEAPDG